jgi:hypothetical protein
MLLLLIPAWLIDLTGNLKQRAKNNYGTKRRNLGKSPKKIKKKKQKSASLKSHLITFSTKLYYSVVPYLSPKHVHCAAQSRQSARVFLQSSELGLLTRRRVCFPPFGSGGGVGGERTVHCMYLQCAVYDRNVKSCCKWWSGRVGGRVL